MLSWTIFQEPLIQAACMLLLSLLRLYPKGVAFVVGGINTCTAKCRDVSEAAD
jgi:hypothetical protein